MKKFVRKIGLLFFFVGGILLVSFLFGRFIVGHQNNTGYLASLVDKVNRLESINDPKIILVGHSNLAFGIHSDMIEEEIGMPVVNLGFHGALGNAIHEEIAKLNINEGDIVILCHSTYSEDDKIIDPSLAWNTYDWHDSLWRIFRIKDYPALMRAYPLFLSQEIELWMNGWGNGNIDSSYSRNAFNEYGDVVYKPDVYASDTDEIFQNTPIEVPKIDESSVKRINKLNNYCKKCGATLLVAGYPIAYGKYADFTEEDFVFFQNELSEKLDCDVISNYPDYFYPYEYFYDSVLHMTDEGAVSRTTQLINDIKEWQKNKN